MRDAIRGVEPQCGAVLSVGSEIPPRAPGEEKKVSFRTVAILEVRRPSTGFCGAFR